MMTVIIGSRTRSSKSSHTARRCHASKRRSAGLHSVVIVCIYDSRQPPQHPLANAHGPLCLRHKTIHRQHLSHLLHSQLLISRHSNGNCSFQTSWHVRLLLQCRPYSSFNLLKWPFKHRYQHREDFRSALVPSLSNRIRIGTMHHLETGTNHGNFFIKLRLMMKLCRTSRLLLIAQVMIGNPTHSLVWAQGTSRDGKDTFSLAIDLSRAAQSQSESQLMIQYIRSTLTKFRVMHCSITVIKELHRLS
mmetsp:Transcript_15646/g.33791  ORF Transcript_15646/g.33791 Transcript_15646/m.33791 type:complete len:247 (-) Transcript_15646:945-1685(-)